jgi:hypothetical protein
MSTALLASPAASPLRRAIRRLWLAYRISEAERDHRGLCEQIQRDLAQAEAITAQIAEWRAEIAFNQNPRRDQ